MFHRIKKTIIWMACNVVLTVLFMAVQPAQAQITELLSQVENPDVPDTLRGWDVRWTGTLNGAQASYSNWAKGGANSVSVNSSSVFRLLYRRGQFAYEFRTRARYGQTRIKDEGVRKTEDRWEVRHRFLYDLSEDHDEFKIFGNINMDTQFDRGYKYGDGPNGTDLYTSNFFAPAYFVQNGGLAYFPSDNFSVEGGFGFKQTIVQDTLLSKRYGLEEGDTFRSEAGFTFGLNFEKEILENVVYTGYIETFSNLLKHLTRTDIYISNEIVGRINNYLNTTFQLELVYNENHSDDWQMSQLLTAGISVRIF